MTRPYLLQSSSNGKVLQKTCLFCIKMTQGFYYTLHLAHWSTVSHFGGYNYTVNTVVNTEIVYTCFVGRRLQRVFFIYEMLE